MTTVKEKTILIADDDPSSTLLAEAALADAGFRVLVANGGEEALRQFEAHRPDCLVLDVMMPDLSGFDVCRRVRARPDGRRVPILMLTNLSDHASISESYNVGASDFTQKDKHPRLLVERVRFLLRDRDLEDELVTSQARLEQAQRIARVGHWELGVDGTSLAVSPLVGELFGLTSGKLASYADFLARLAPEDAAETRAAFRACAEAGIEYSRDHRMEDCSGSAVVLHQQAQRLPRSGESGGPVILVTLQDITRLQRAEDTARTLMYTDVATRLPNRRYFAESIEVALSGPEGGEHTVVIAVRVQNLDRAVAAHGEGFGNALLASVAKRIVDAITIFAATRFVRDDAVIPTVARIAGDELGILLKGGPLVAQMATATASMLSVVSRPLVCLGIEYVPVASAGIAVAAHDGTDADSLISYAHIAANQSADVGGYSFYSEQLQTLSRRRLSLESDLRLAVERDQLDLVFQPRVMLAGHRLVSVEALLRWQHPELGSVSPAEFIPIAEQSALIGDIGRWVLARACEQLTRWRAAGLSGFGVAVNLSPRQLADKDLPRAVHAALVHARLPAQALELEITETCVVAAGEDARRRLDELRASGVQVALDDFGTGYSSLGQIRRLPVDCLKLDRSLIADLRLDRGAQGIVAAVFAMARTLGVRSCAEGVGDAETLRMLTDLGCDEVQGYYVCKPLDAAALATWIGRGGADSLLAAAAAATSEDSVPTTEPLTAPGTA
jgi:PAS domain S-box-containing protein